MKTSEEFFKEYSDNTSLAEGHYDYLVEKNSFKEAMIEFAKMHVLKIKHLQQSKYYSGETGYIKSEEWENIINNIK